MIAAPSRGMFSVPVTTHFAYGNVSGLAQPTYVLDIPGGHGKSPVGPNYVGEGVVEDPNGQTHPYPPLG